MLRVALATYRGLSRLNDDDILLKNALEKHGIEVDIAIWNEAHTWEHCDVVVIRSCWDYINAPQAFQSWIEHLHMNDVCVLNPPATIAWNQQKSYLKDLAQKSVSTVPTLWLDHSFDLSMLAPQIDHFRTQKIVMKPSIGNDAHGVVVVGRDDVESCLHEMFRTSFTGEILVQPFLPAIIEEGEWSLIFIDREYSHTILKKPANGDFRSQHTRGGSFLSVEPPFEALEMAKRAISASPPSIYARVDLIQHNGVYVVGEVEMIEPYLYFQTCPESAERLAIAIIKAYEQHSKVHRVTFTQGNARGHELAIRSSLNMWFEHASKSKRFQIGYPISQDLDHKDMACFLDLHINNVGDPFSSSNLINSFDAEKEILRFFAELFHAPASDYWGYVTSGGTECNLYGLWAARSRLPNGAVYFSEESHYSVGKILDILHMDGVRVPTNPDGTICIRKLADLANRNRHDSVIWHANVGTTMKGAVDDIQGGIQALREAGVEEVHVHCDAALFGPMIPFFQESPIFDFRHEEVASIAVSGHKFIGCPVPVGIVLSRKSLCKPGSKVEYIGGTDSTVSGSRSGLGAILIWKELQKRGMGGLAQRAARCLEMTLYAIARMEEIGVSAWAHPYSNTVVFPRPSETLIKKWHLASQGDISHVILMPGIDTKIIDNFIQDLSQELTH